MYSIYLTNMGYTLDKQYHTLSEALDRGKETGFEFGVYRSINGMPELIASYNVFGRVKYYVREHRREAR